MTPTDSAILEADPARMELLAQKIVGMAAAAKALAAAAPSDGKSAVAVMGVLAELQLA